MNVPRAVLALAALVFASALMGARRGDGTLMIRSLTAGAEVRVDGRSIATLPMRLPLALPPGEHTLKVTKPGHAPYIDTFVIKRGRDTVLDVDLIAVSAVLAVRADPAGTQVIVDGRVMGAAPWTGDVKPGNRRVELRAEGHATWSRIVRAELGQVHPIDVSLIPSAADPAGGDPWYAEPWVWAGAGAAVAVAVIAAAVVVAQPEPRADPDITLTIEVIQ